MQLLRLNGFALLALLLAGCASVETQYEAWPADERSQVHVDLAQSYLERGQLDVAEEEFNKALKATPRSDKAYHGLGLVETQKLNFTKAKSLMAKAVAINPNNLEAVADYALLLCRSGDAAKGAEMLERTHRSNKHTDTIGMHVALGRCYQADNQPEAAQNSLGQALALEPQLSQALFSMAQVRFAQAEALSARGFIQRYFATGAMSSRALLLGAQIEELLGNKQERIRYTNQLSERYPQSKALQQSKQKFK